MSQETSKSAHDRRREEAVQRQEAYAKIPLEQRLKTAGKKETAKIKRKLEGASST